MAERKLVSSITVVEQTSGGRRMGQTRRHTALGIMAVTAGIAVLGGEIAWPVARAQPTIPGLEARVVAINIPSASAIAQVGTFLNVPPPPCGRPIPAFFPSYIQPGAVLDPNRILVGSRSNFRAPLAMGVGGRGHSCRSIRAGRVS
jgi:hypothetical protein